MKWAPYCLPQGDPPGVIYILHFILYLYPFLHQSSSLINHQPSTIIHQSSVINHQSSIINDQSSVIHYQSSIYRQKHTHLQQIKKKERKQLSPEARKKKESSSKSLNDVKKTKRKSVKNYPRRNEKKGELFKVSKRRQHGPVRCGSVARFGSVLFLLPGVFCVVEVFVLYRFLLFLPPYSQLDVFP